MYYHASQTKGIKVLEPRVSNHNKPLIYFSSKKENVLVYLSNAVEKFCKESNFEYDGIWSKWASYGFTKDGILEIQEYYKNATYETYKGVSGYIYKVEEVDKIEKQNLIPEEIKQRHYKKYLVGFVVLVSVFLLVSVAIPYLSMGIVSRQIARIERENEAYKFQQEEISSLDAEIEIYSKLINEYESVRFPFSQFMFDLETLKPVSVHIISVDTQDRLINEGAMDEKEKEKPGKGE